MEVVKADAADVVITQPDDLYAAYRYITVIGLAKFHVFRLTTYVIAAAISAIDLLYIHLTIYAAVEKICAQ
jgi:hypothetical protein